MQERFKQLLEEKNLTATRFAAMIKVNASAMSHILNGRSKPGFDVLDKIAQAFPDVNLNWLISVASIPTAKGKKVKWIILFFEDGSFEDYEK